MTVHIYLFSNFPIPKTVSTDCLAHHSTHQSVPQLVAQLKKLTLCVLSPTPTQPLKIHPNLVSTVTKHTDFTIFPVTKH